MHLRILLLSCMLLLPGYTSGPGASRGVDDGDVIVFQDVRVFDGEKVISSSTVVVRGGFISAVGTELEYPPDATIIDGKGHTLLPGFIDCHVHVIFPAMLKQALVFGVTTELDMFMAHSIASGIKKKQAEGKGLDQADLRSAGTLVTAPGGHGTQYGIRIPTITKPEKAQKFVDARIAEGSDYIKIVYDDGSAYGISFNTINRETLHAVIEAAHNSGKLAVVHIGTLQGAKDAITAGADGLVHLFSAGGYDPDFGKLAAEFGAFVIPTLTVIEGITGTAGGASLVDDPKLSEYISPLSATQLKQIFQFGSDGGKAFVNVKRTVLLLKQSGVPILAGTDAPNPGTDHGVSIHRELELLVDSGLSPMEALAAATSVPAGLFGLDDRGRIAPGLRADLVLVKGDPTTHIQDSRAIAGVWKLGSRLDREKYLADIKKQRENIERLRTAPPPEGSESGLVSDFEGGKISAEFGAGWIISTDSMMGGKSTAKMKLVKGGAGNSKGALLITGKIVEGAAFKWAGVMFSPGKNTMAPSNLSAKKEISFWAKGDGKTFSVMVFAGSLGNRPATRSFTAGSEWQKFTFPISDFNGIEGYDIMGVFIGSYTTLGEFTLQIDNISID